MSRFMVGNLYLVLSMLCATASHILLKGLIDQVQPESLSWSELSQFLTAPRLLRLVSAGILLVGGFLSWLACLARLDLSYAYPVASTSVLLVAAFSIAVLGESVSWRTWLGTVLILAGIVLLRPQNS
jgi:drug/metabolite transporter (DMT)-like permease